MINIREYFNFNGFVIIIVYVYRAIVTVLAVTVRVNNHIRLYPLNSNETLSTLSYSIETRRSTVCIDYISRRENIAL